MFFFMFPLKITQKCAYSQRKLVFRVIRVRFKNKTKKTAEPEVQRHFSQLRSC